VSIISDTSRTHGVTSIPGLRGLGRAAQASGSAVVSLAGASAILGLIWAAAAAWQPDLPGPVSAMGTFWGLVRDPFYDNGPNDKGIGLQLLASLKRVFTGFALGALVAIPLGVLIGSNRVFRRFFDPVVQVLKPVSPLAWFPIGLVTLQSAPNAAIFVVFICSLWPTVINTAAGVSSIPESHKNVARVFQFNGWKYLTRIVLPHSLPYIITGLRLSMGVAWLVIVAAEMLSGGTGIGFYVWDSWNALNLEQVLSAILLIGIIGLALDRLFAAVGALFSYPEVA
jgi:nitrate/nitrite transport system permease protein